MDTKPKIDSFESQINQLLRAVYESIDHGITVQSPEGKLLYANEAAAKLTGYSSASELLNRPSTDISQRYVIFNEKGQILKSEDLPGRKALKGEKPGSMVVKFRYKNSPKEYWSEIKAVPIFDKNRKLIFVINIFQDITERKQTELSINFLANASKLLSSSLDYKKTLQSVAQLAVSHVADWCAVDMVLGDKIELLAIAHSDPKKVKWAKEYRKQAPPDLSQNTGMVKVLKTGKPEFYPEITEELINKSVRSEEEKSLINKIGLTSIMIVPLLIQKKPVGVITFISSHRSFTEDDLSIATQLADRSAIAIDNASSYQIAQKLAAIVETSDDAIISKNLKGLITSWNKGAEKLYGFSPAEVVGRNIRIIIPQDKLEEERGILEVIKIGQGIDHLETVRVTKDGRRIDVSLTISPIKDNFGKVIGASKIARDISNTKELERRKDAFISMASHELKTPITTIKAYVQVLQRKIDPLGDDLLSKFLNKTDDQLNRLTELVSDLLDLSKIQAGKLELNREPFNLNALIKDLIEDTQATSPQHKIVFEGHLKEVIVGDKQRISQVIINLLSNAIKYSPEGKAVLVEIVPNKNKVTVSVRDYGIGISKTHQVRIFDRFYRAAGNSEKTFPGLGIGLYISSEIVKRHGGKIWVDSVKRKGSTFSFTLPLNT